MTIIFQADLRLLLFVKIKILTEFNQQRLYMKAKHLKIFARIVTVDLF